MTQTGKLVGCCAITQNVHRAATVLTFISILPPSTSYLSISLFIYLFIHLCVCLSIYLTVSPAVALTQGPSHSKPLSPTFCHLSLTLAVQRSSSSSSMFAFTASLKSRSTWALTVVSISKSGALACSPTNVRLVRLVSRLASQRNGFSKL